MLNRMSFRTNIALTTGNFSDISVSKNLYDSPASSVILPWFCALFHNCFEI